MLTGFLLLAGSAALLTGGAELFAEHAAAAGRRLGVTALAVGLVLAGAEPEELVTALFATVRHHPGIAAGDAIGANVTMLTAVLGLAALVRPVPFGRRVRPYAVAAAVAGFAAALTVAGGRVDRLRGTLLVVAYLVLLAVVWLRERRPPAFGEAAELQESEPGRAGRLLPVGLLLVGIALMTLGGRVAVAGAERVVQSLGLHDSTVGLTFVALATTAELFALVWSTARRGATELAVAAVLGSAVYNATVTLGVAALVRPLAVSRVGVPAWCAAGIPLLLLTASLRSGRLPRLAGALLLAGYGGYLALTFG